MLWLQQTVPPSNTTVQKVSKGTDKEEDERYESQQNERDLHYEA